MLNQKEKYEFGLLILRVIEEEVTEEEFAYINRQIIENEAYRQYYCAYISAYSALQRADISYYAGQEDKRLDLIFDPAFWKEMADYEQTAIPAQLPTPLKEPELVTGILERKKQLQPHRHVSRLSLYTAIGGLAALFVMIAYVMLNPRIPERTVAVITEMVDATWADVDTAPRIGQTIYNTTYELHLTSGVVKLTYDSNAEVLVEGPAVFSCETADSMRLIRGKVFASLPVGASGFTVTTPTSRVIDLGTQFGVAVHHDGGSTVQVYEGKASLIGGFSGQSLETMTLSEFGARRIDGQTGQVRSISFDPVAFVRHIDTQSGFIWSGRPFDLADAVIGGDGFGSGRAGAGINPETGVFNDPYVRYGRGYIAPEATTSPVSTHPFVDCVFIPDGDAGPQPVTTQGHLFGDFEPTDRRFHHDIMAVDYRHAMPQDQDELQEQNSHVLARMDVTVNGVRYGAADRQALLIHAPSGITFDLDAIAQSLPGLTIERFESIVGIPDEGRQEASLDIWVLIDGVCVFRYDHYISEDEPIVLDIPLSPDNRYLTLAVTDAGDESWYDLCVFGRPRLVLKDK